MSDFKTRLQSLRFNPMLTQNMILDELQRQLDDKGTFDIPDASHPFPFLLEATVLNAHMNMVEDEASTRRQYPSMALTSEDLYLHMSDDDYLGRFAAPAWTEYELYVSRAEVLRKAIEVPGSNVRKLVLPRMTEFRAADTTFTMQYPIEFRLMSHGGLQVVYDSTVSSPIQTLESNMVDWMPVRLNGEELLRLTIPVGQFSITTYNEAINAATGFNADYTFSDYFYYARVYISDGSGNWSEIHTTHTDQVYDPNQVTAVLQVNGSSLNVKIPLIYFTMGLVTGELRIDVYTTKGEIDVDLGSYEASQFSMNMRTLDDDPTYVSPLTTFNRIQSLNANRVTGGSYPISFAELRNRVMDNTLGASRVPITHAQIGTELENRGYKVVTNIDNITNRQFLASRRLPNPDNDNLSSGAGCTMGVFQSTLEDIAASAHSYDNGNRVTVKPSMLFQYVNGVIERVSDMTIESLHNQSPDSLARMVNGARYLYSPFHYVLDVNDERFDVRPYYLDQPEILSKVFVSENDTAQIQVSIDTWLIERVERGYRLRVKLKSGDRFKEIGDDDVYVQMGYRPTSELSYASLNGTLVGTEDGERVYEFYLDTQMDIDQSHQLYTTNFSMFDEAQHDFATPLEGDFDFTFIVTDQDMRNYDQTDMDIQVQKHLLPEEFMAISRERLRIRLGYDLSQLWNRNRSLLSEYVYKTYDADVPYEYTETIFKRDENGQIILSQDGDGNIVYEVLHAKGDPVLNEDGSQRMRHLKGDRIIGPDGKPEMIHPRRIIREMTLFLTDGIYYFVSDSASIDYRSEIPMTLVGWLRNDVDLIEERLLEQSELYLYPTATFGDTTALVGEGLNSTVALDQSMYVNYYLSSTAYSNSDLREVLSQTTREIVNEMLGRTTVVISDIITRLKENGGDDVISIEVGGLGDSNNFSTLSVTDEAVRLSLRQRLAVQSNQLLSAEDDIDIAFLRHSTG